MRPKWWSEKRLKRWSHLKPKWWLQGGPKWVIQETYMVITFQGKKLITLRRKWWSHLRLNWWSHLELVLFGALLWSFPVFCCGAFLCSALVLSCALIWSFPSLPVLCCGPYLCSAVVLSCTLTRFSCALWCLPVLCSGPFLCSAVILSCALIWFFPVLCCGLFQCFALLLSFPVLFSGPFLLWPGPSLCSALVLSYALIWFFLCFEVLSHRLRMFFAVFVWHFWSQQSSQQSCFVLGRQLQCTRWQNCKESTSTLKAPVQKSASPSHILFSPYQSRWKGHIGTLWCRRNTLHIQGVYTIVYYCGGPWIWGWQNCNSRAQMLEPHLLVKVHSASAPGLNHCRPQCHIRMAAEIDIAIFEWQTRRHHPKTASETSRV